MNIPAMNTTRHDTKPRYGLVTWPDSQDFVGNPHCILVNPPEDNTDLDSAYLVPEDITGPLDAGGAYLRIPWPEAQAWEEMPEGAEEGDILHDYDTTDAYVLESLYNEHRKSH